MASIQPIILNPDPIKLEVTQDKIVNAISPTIEAERTDDGALLTITDYQHTETIMVYDGESGSVDPEVIERIEEEIEQVKDDIPTNVSELNNDAGYITEETDPTVPAWAKSPSKPSYTAAEVGALPDDTVVPQKVSDLQNDAGYITVYTETDPTVPSWAKQPTKPSYTAQEVGALPSDTEIPQKVSDLQNDAGYITGYTETDPTVPAWAKASSKPTYTAQEVGALPDTTVIPTKVSDLTDDSGHYTKPASGIPASDLASGVLPNIHVNGTTLCFS